MRNPWYGISASSCRTKEPDDRIEDVRETLEERAERGGLQLYLFEIGVDPLPEAAVAPTGGTG